MAQETRLEILRLLVRHSPDGLKAGEISRCLGIVPSTLSGHLNVLKRSGLVISRRNRREIICSVNLDTINAVMRFILEECCNGNPDACEPRFEIRRPATGAGQAGK